MLHLQEGNFQQYQRLCNDTAVHLYWTALTINRTLTEKETLIVSLRRITNKRPENASDGWQPPKFIHEQRRKGQPTADGSESPGMLLDSPVTASGRFVLSASLANKGSKERWGEESRRP